MTSFASISAATTECERIRDNMVVIENKAENLLAQQYLATGDDTHYYRKSLIHYHMWLTGEDQRTAEDKIDDYLVEHRALKPVGRSMRRGRRIITGGRISQRLRPEQLAAAWSLFAAGILGK